jgi:hypothetical protein
MPFVLHTDIWAFLKTKQYNEIWTYRDVRLINHVKARLPWKGEEEDRTIWVDLKTAE